MFIAVHCCRVLFAGRFAGRCSWLAGSLLAVLSPLDTPLDTLIIPSSLVLVFAAVSSEQFRAYVFSKTERMDELYPNGRPAPESNGDSDRTPPGASGNDGASGSSSGNGGNDSPPPGPSGPTPGPSGPPSSPSPSPGSAALSPSPGNGSMAQPMASFCQLIFGTTLQHHGILSAAGLSLAEGYIALDTMAACSGEWCCPSDT